MKFHPSDITTHGHRFIDESPATQDHHYRMGGGGGGAPAETKTDKEIKRLNLQQLRKQSQEKTNDSLAGMAEVFKLPSPIAPPPSQTSQDSEAASQEARRRLLRNSSLRKSRIATPGMNTGALGGGGKLGS